MESIEENKSYKKLLIESWVQTLRQETEASLEEHLGRIFRYLTTEPNLLLTGNEKFVASGLLQSELLPPIDNSSKKE